MKFMLRLERLIGFLVAVAVPLAAIVIAGLWILDDTERVIAMVLTIMIILAGIFIWWRVAKNLQNKEADKPND